MTIAYFDCFSGISGDMTLGALVDAGVRIEDLRAELEKLHLPGYEITALKVRRAGIASTKVHVCLEDREQPERHLSDIEKIISSSELAPSIKEKGIAIFSRLAEAEARVHGVAIDHVHFHEVGAVDAIVDIVGAVIGCEMLGISSIMASPVNLGSGTIHCGHGTLPVPAPATVELLHGVPSYGSSIPFELTTPTGAAIISTLASSFGPMPCMTPMRTAYGAGGRDLHGQANVLRLTLGKSLASTDTDTAVSIETNIDDMNPQLYEFVIERLLAGGALDATLTPVIMKKGRPGVLLSVLCDASRQDALMEIIFRETTSIGVRMHELRRAKLTREFLPINTPFGTVRMKVSRRGDSALTATPEYEDCKRIAEERQLPLKQVMDDVKNRYSRGGSDR